MLVFRWERRIVGRSVVTVRSGKVDAESIRHAAGAVSRDLRFVWLAKMLQYDDREVVSPTPLTATAVICTRDRADDLERALEGLTRQTRRADEILVIDNAPSSDRTRDVVHRFSTVRYIRVPAPGLNLARNRAIAESSTDIIAFTDDDATPEPEWLESLLRNFGDPRVMCATGLTLPSELETEAQELFEQLSPFARGFRQRTFDGQHDNPLEVGFIGAGANMALRRSIFDEVGPFDPRLDGGTPSRSGGDHEMFVRILAAGHRILYDPSAVSWHRHRRTHAELMATLYGYGVGVYAMWTGLVLEQHEIGVARLAWSWFRSAHWPEIRRAIHRRPPTIASSAVRSEFLGCLNGPRAWFASKRLATARGRE
ncbi:MAG TPA: glycosyltransferase [Vicinamibacterales bacterium]|nr:glycosyltransferase [Vicinamibacterales bacterium]